MHVPLCQFTKYPLFYRLVCQVLSVRPYTLTILKFQLLICQSVYQIWVTSLWLSLIKRCHSDDVVGAEHSWRYGPFWKLNRNCLESKYSLSACYFQVELNRPKKSVTVDLEIYNYSYKEPNHTEQTINHN